MPTIGIALLTYRSKNHLSNCLPPLLKSSLQPKIILVDTYSNDGTVELAQKYGLEVISIPQSQFNHGRTRERARKILATEIVIFITPDAYLQSPETLDFLIDPIVQKKASVAYARQLPHDNAHFLESFPRHYNYPAESHIRSIEDEYKYGSYLFFCSNSCAAYCNQSLDEVGGFKKVLLGEDTVAVAELLRNGHKIAYVSEAKVKHSHKYSLKEEFKRYFDTGIARKDYHHLLATNDRIRGTQFAKQLFKTLLKEKPMLIPYAILHTGAKWLGYEMGRKGGSLPVWFKKKLSSQLYYWNSSE